MDIVQADRADFEAIRGLLQEAGLPTEGVGGAGGTYLVARQGSAVIGCVGLEVYGIYGLLRSLTVVPERRGRGVGTALARRALELAQEKGLHRVFLLTATAAGFFPRLGFAPCPREEAPEEIKGSAEFSSLCPLSATLMAGLLNAPAHG